MRVPFSSPTFFLRLNEINCSLLNTWFTLHSLSFPLCEGSKAPPPFFAKSNENNGKKRKKKGQQNSPLYKLHLFQQSEGILAFPAQTENPSWACQNRSFPNISDTLKISPSALLPLLLDFPLRCEDSIWWCCLGSPVFQGHFIEHFTFSSELTVWGLKNS